MTSPEYRPAPTVGWWVKSNHPIFGDAVDESWTGETGTYTKGLVITGSAVSTFWTGQTGTYTTGPAITGARASEVWTGQSGGIIRALSGAAAAEGWAGQVGRVGAQYFDDFNRADSTTSVGTNWTNRQFTMGINGNAAYPVSGFVVTFATYNLSMIIDNMAVDITLGSHSGGGDDGVSIVLGANTAGQCVTLSCLQGSTWTIESRTAWNSSTTRASTTGSYTSGDVLTLQRVGNVYTALKNGSTIGLAWTDGSNVVPRDSSHRLVGIGGNTALGSGGYRRIDYWSAENI